MLPNCPALRCRCRRRLCDQMICRMYSKEQAHIHGRLRRGLKAVEKHHRLETAHCDAFGASSAGDTQTLEGDIQTLEGNIQTPRGWSRREGAPALSTERFVDERHLPDLCPRRHRIVQHSAETREAVCRRSTYSTPGHWIVGLILRGCCARQPRSLSSTCCRRPSDGLGSKNRPPTGRSDLEHRGQDFLRPCMGPAASQSCR